MGFYYNAITLPKSIPPFTFLLTLLTHATFLLTAALTRLGLRKPPPPPDQQQQEEDHDDPYILMPNGSSPSSLVPIPVSVVTAAIKDRVPVLLYGDWVRQRRGGGGEDEEGCSICLESIELKDEVRELAMCRHTFHKACLDRWIDAGQVNCPLCRAMLLPPTSRINPPFTCTCTSTTTSTSSNGVSNRTPTPLS